MEGWIITAECGDYYCGCGDGHLLGVFLDATDAEKELRFFENDTTGTCFDKKWIDVTLSPIVVGVPLEAHSEVRYVKRPSRSFIPREDFISINQVQAPPRIQCAVGAITQAMFPDRPEMVEKGLLGRLRDRLRK